MLLLLNGEEKPFEERERGRKKKKNKKQKKRKKTLALFISSTMKEAVL